jgi:hypothetical protein
LLTTTLNSKNPCNRRVPEWLRWLLVPILVGLFSGCAPLPPPTAESFFELSPETARHQALQTRMFETIDEKELLSASAAVLQDLGFQIEESVTDVGILRAAKERSAREYGQEINQALILLISTASVIVGGTIVVVPVDVHQQINATLATRRSDTDPSRYSVRILFHRSLWKGDGSSGNRNIPPGQQNLEIIVDAKIYQLFFAKLSKSVFLEAHKI